MELALDEETGELYQLVPLRLWRAACAALQGVDELPEPAGRGECWECARELSEPLWIVGDFWLCRRCVMRRAVVRSRLDYAS
jgi:hypothetical protein